MKRALTIVICIVSLFLLTACEEEQLTFTEPTLYISRDGSVTQTIVEEFDKEYYSLYELRGDIGTSVNEYNKSTSVEDSVMLTDAYVDDGKVYISLKYATVKDFGDFQQSGVYYGLAKDAYAQGYIPDFSYASTLDASVIGKEDFAGFDKNHILITDLKGTVIVPYNILYISDNVDFVNEKAARISSDYDGLAYIVMK